MENLFFQKIKICNSLAEINEPISQVNMFIKEWTLG